MQVQALHTAHVATFRNMLAQYAANIGQQQISNKIAAHKYNMLAVKHARLAVVESSKAVTFFTVD